LFKEKHASKCEELDVLRVEVAELKSRSALLGACTSCPILHAIMEEMHAYIVSLEAKLKEPIPTSCSTCELHALNNLELAHYVDRLRDENDEMRKLRGWLPGHEPQLRIMIETFKRQDGEGLRANKDKYHPSDGVLESRVLMPRAKASVRTVQAWGERKAVGGAVGRATLVRPVRGTGQTGADLDKQQFGFRARTGARIGSRGRGSAG
jgi:hypothetical protein